MLDFYTYTATWADPYSSALLQFLKVYQWGLQSRCSLAQRGSFFMLCNTLNNSATWAAETQPLWNQTLLLWESGTEEEELQQEQEQKCREERLRIASSGEPVVPCIWITNLVCERNPAQTLCSALLGLSLAELFKPKEWFMERGVGFHPKCEYFRTGLSPSSVSSIFSRNILELSVSTEQTTSGIKSWILNWVK